MTVLTELRRLLGTNSTRVSGKVQRVGTVVQVRTPNGMESLPLPNFTVRANDVVIVEGHQIVYNVGQGDTIDLIQV
ncbi:hypothetical protein VH22019_00099 [Vibrio phage VH2_2019]|nr:hypothetical protein VH22019_00099 [Vibrio phage VH2_2019]